MGSENYNVIAYDITAETAQVAAEVGYALHVQVVNRFSPIAFTWRAPDTGHLLEASGSVAVNESKVK